MEFVVKRKEKSLFECEKIEDVRELAGEEYLNNLFEAVNVRIDRRKKYGDSYRDMDSLGHYYHAYNKFHRLNTQLESDDTSQEFYEKIDDNIIDIINYLVFMLVQRKREKADKCVDYFSREKTEVNPTTEVLKDYDDAFESVKREQK